MKKPEVKLFILVIYLQAILVLYFWFLYPALAGSKNLASTNIPALSVSSLREANLLFMEKGKEWKEYPQEPDLSIYAFGQTDPIQITKSVK